MSVLNKYFHTFVIDLFFELQCLDFNEVVIAINAMVLIIGIIIYFGVSVFGLDFLIFGFGQEFSFRCIPSRDRTRPIMAAMRETSPVRNTCYP